MYYATGTLPLGFMYMEMDTVFIVSDGEEVPFPVSKRSKTRVCGLSLAGIAGSSPSWGVDILSFVRVVCCQVEVLATFSSIRILPSVVCHCV